MKCLCFSDSHGTSHTMRTALLAHRDAEVAFFLGDGLYDLYDVVGDFPAVAFYSVRGNCDIAPCFSHIEKCESVTLMDKKILLTHGDLFSVKGSFGSLLAYAGRNGYDVALFGHTHIPTEYYDSSTGIYLFNPGSISDRYDGRSYGILTISDSGVLFSHGKVSF